MSPDEVVGRAHARAGVAGNPSDALGGAALAVPVTAMSARVRIRPAERLTVRSAGASGWASVDELAEHVARVGHDGGDRLVTAAMVTLRSHLVAHDVAPDPSPFALDWDTDIPRSVGLAGSSALVIATMRALCVHWGVELEPSLLAQLALSAEVDQLGIAAGWMDRAVQAHDRPVLVDRRADPDAVVPAMRVVEPSAPVELLVAWDPAGASPSGRLHSSLRDRYESGDTEVAAAVDDLVDVARRAAEALARADVVALADEVDRSCALRRRLGALDDATAALVSAVRSAGGVATSAGSGGAVLVVPTSRSVPEIADLLDRVDVPCVRVRLAPDLPGPAGLSEGRSR